MREERDELIGRIVDELKVLPAVPADATARVLARVDAARRGEGSRTEVSDDDDIIFFPAGTDEMPAAATAVGRPMPSGAIENGSRSGGWRRRFVVSLPAAIGYALAATLAGFLIRGALPEKEPSALASTPQRAGESTATSPTVVTPVVGIASRELQERPVAVQFVLDDKRAGSVALVGDFNAWDGTSTPLVRDSVTGVWSTVVAVTPGRHVYAFLVDGQKWTLDPRAPRTKDADYGTEQSVIIVGLQ